MSQHDLVSAQSSSVCITHNVALNSIACVMSLPAMSLRDWFSVRKKGEAGVGGLVYIYTKKDENSMAVCGCGYKNPPVCSL